MHIVLTGVFLVLIVISGSYLVYRARLAVETELISSMVFAQTFISALMAEAQSREEFVAQVDVLQRNADVRHIRLSVSEDAPGNNEVETPKVAGVPHWFTQAVSPSPGRLVQSFGIAGRPSWLSITADPSAEIREAWSEISFTLSVLCLLFVVASILVFYLVGRAMRPLDQISNALAGVGRGELEVRVSPVGIPEIDLITHGYNGMADTLAQSQQENERLAQRALAVREDEQQHLARELHDELGQSITAIKALAVSIRTHSQSDENQTVSNAASTIASVSTDIYAQVRQMMTRLHPAILDELGLRSALELMMDDWNSHHEDTFCEWEFSGDADQLDGGERINVYRIVQEALTNVAKHANATKVRVRLAANATNDIELRVKDDGRGFNEDAVERGLGLRGMRERATALGGILQVHSVPNDGTALELRFKARAA
ncbi:MAG: ATP-binding protein [Pseudomonadota bacterium]